MTSEGLIAFLGVAALLIVTPGQDMALVLRNTLGGGRRSGICTACGVVSGLVVWALVASAGLAALLQTSQVLFTTLKIAGAVYLAYLGLQALRSALARTPEEEFSEAGRVQSTTDLTALRQGLISNLGNPKIAVFFSSLLPQFVDDGSAGFAPALALGLLFCALTLVWLSAYATLLARVRAVMRRARVRRTIDAITGVVLVGLGLRLATARR